ncbi:MAG: GMC family oxidoreductase [Thermoanaerobaculia bacterium]
MSRFLPEDFQLRSLFGCYEAVTDWPFSYLDLEPFYTQAEQEIGVSGRAGINPYEGPRSADYPMAPLSEHPLAKELDEVCARHHLHPFPTPRAVNSAPYGGRPACQYCDRCAGFGCPTGARGTVQEALLPRALATGRCRLLTHARVRAITVSEQGRARGCVYLDDAGQEHEVLARLVCVCCSAVESARLLLLSACSRFPDGLANNSGQVGKNLQFHGTSVGITRFRFDGLSRLELRDPQPFLGRALMDYYFLPSSAATFPTGGTLLFQNLGWPPLMTAKVLALAGEKTLWGNRLIATLQGYYERARTVGFEVHHAFTPNEKTYVDLDPQTQDSWGIPAARIHLAPTADLKPAGGFLVQRGLEILAELGADEVLPPLVGEVAPYLVHGTCRAGQDPETSVLDAHCRSHEVPNLFVVDGSFMPTSGGAPPTLTILANSFRVAAFIIEEGQRGAW